MDFAKVLEEWAADPANASNPFQALVAWLATIVAFIASL